MCARNICEDESWGEKASQISLVIVDHDTPKLVEELLASLERSRSRSRVGDIVIVYNGRREGLPLYSFPDSLKRISRVIHTPAQSYATAVNIGVRHSNRSILVICNSDIVFPPDADIAVMARILSCDQRLGAISPQLVYPDGKWQRSGGLAPGLSEAIFQLTFLSNILHWWQRISFARGRSRRLLPVQYVDAAFMMVRRSTFDEIGGFDDSFKFYCEDADFCRRLSAKGLKCAVVPDVRMIHTRGASSTRVDLYKYAVKMAEAKTKFIRKCNRFPGVLQIYRVIMVLSALERWCLSWLFGGPAYRYRICAELKAWLSVRMEVP